MDKANILFDESTAKTLREAAASLDFYITRGPGSGEVGNIKAFMEWIAKVYLWSPEEIVQMKIRQDAREAVLEDFNEHFERETTLEGSQVYEQAAHLAQNAYESKEEQEVFIQAYAHAYEAVAAQHDIFPFNR